MKVVKYKDNLFILFSLLFCLHFIAVTDFMLMMLFKYFYFYHVSIDLYIFLFFSLVLMASYIYDIRGKLLIITLLLLLLGVHEPSSYYHVFCFAYFRNLTTLFSTKSYYYFYFFLVWSIHVRSNSGFLSA